MNKCNKESEGPIYIENYKTLLCAIEDTKTGKDILCSVIRRMNIVKMAMLPKAMYRFNVIPIKSQWYFSKKQIEKNQI